MERRDRAPWPALRRGRGARYSSVGPRAAVAACILILVLAGCWSEPPATPEPLEAISAEEGGEEPPAEEAGGEEAAGAEDPVVPPQEGGAGGEEAGGGGAPGATPQVVPLGTPRGTPRAGTPRAGTPAQIPLSDSDPTAIALATRGAGGVPTANTTGGGPPTTGGGPRVVPPLTVPDIQTAEAGGISVPPPIKTAVAQGTPVTVPELLLTAEAAGIEIPPALQTAVAQGTISAELLALLTPSAGASPATDGGPTETAGEPTAAPTEAFTATETPTVTGALLIAKTDNGGLALAGACFTLTATDASAAVVGPLCDGDAADGNGADGQIQFDNVLAGEYTLSETAPTGFIAAEAQTVTIGPGVVPLTIANAPIPTDVGSIRLPLVDVDSNPMVDAAGNALPNNCVTVEPSAGGSPITVCDNGENDADPAAGIVQIDNLPAGEYNVRQDQAPAGFQAFEPFNLTVAAGQPITWPVFSEPAAAEAGAVRVSMTDEAGGALLPGGCVTLSGPAEPLQACDNVDGEPNPDPGVIDFLNVPAGDYVAVEVQPPDGYPAATTTEQNVAVVANVTAPVAFAHAAPAGTEPTATAEASPVVLTAPIAFLNAANEFMLLVPGADQAVQIGADDSVDPSVDPAFSVDWRWLAFASREPEEVFLLDLETMATPTPVDLSVAGRATALTWSPRGATLAVTVTLESGATDVVLLDPAAGHPGRAFGDTAAPETINALEWAPDGLRLAVVFTPPGGAPAVELVEAATLARTPVTVTEGIAADAFYGWSVAGRLLVRANNELWVVDPATRAADSLGGFVDVPLPPAWAADGNAVAFYDGPADSGGQLRISELDGNNCGTGIEDLKAMAWKPGTAELAVVGARDEGGMVLDFVTTDCTATTIEGPLDQPYEQLVWSADGNHLALIGPPNANNARAISLLSTSGVFPLQTAGIFIGDIFGWSPSEAESPPVLILYGDTKFEQPPAEARLWAVVADTEITTSIQGATTDGGYVKDAWVSPRQVEATAEDPAPRRDPAPAVPDANTTGGASGGGGPATDPNIVAVRVTSVDENGAAIAGACIVLTGPESYAAVCDGGDFDAAKDLAGVVQIGPIVPGEYTVSEEPGNFSPAAPKQANVVVGTVTEVTLERGDPGQTDTGGGGVTGVTASWFDPNGALVPGGCLTLTGPQPYAAVCDNVGVDSAPEAGIVSVLNIDPGDYAADETAPPGYAAATQPSQAVTVPAGTTIEIRYDTALAA